MSAHIATKKLYVGIWLTLMVLTVVTAAVSRVDLGIASTAVALAIATTKALLVVLFFMGVKYVSQRMTIVVIVSGLFFLGLLLILSMADYGTRALR
jgi:cytochrome c oxidase subunit IV